MKKKEKLAASLNSASGPDRTYDIAWNNNAGAPGKFTVKNGKSAKEAKGIITAEKGTLFISLNFSGYSEKYIRNSIYRDIASSDLAFDEINIEMNVPRFGSVITTKEYIGELNIGDEVDLDVGIYYYSVDSDLIDCNGAPLREDFRGTFIEEIKRRCDDSSFPAHKYTKFRLR